MSHDNVTPFRRPPRRPPPKRQSSGGLGFSSQRGRAVLAHLLALASFVSAFFFPFPPPDGAGLILILASCISLAFAFGAVALTTRYRFEGMPWTTTHHEHVIRTLLIGYSIWVLASALLFISQALAPVRFYAILIVLIWAVIRSGVGLVLAILRKPIPSPRGWLL